jgi:arylsulfatase A-like enzyme
MCGWSEFHTPNLKGGADTAEEVNAPLLHWLKNNARRDNYFLHINYWDIHRPYHMDASWADRFSGSPVARRWPDETAIASHRRQTGLFTANRLFWNSKSPSALMPDQIASREDVDRLVTGYDAAIAYTDHHVKIILEELDRQRVLDDAVLIFTADHGDAFGEHGIYADHVCADECVHRIPLIVRWPGKTPAGHASDAMFTNVDLPATLCDLLNIPTPSAWDGISFRKQLEGETGGGRDYLVWDHALYAVQRAIRTPQYLMTRTYHPGEYLFAPLELCDMLNDPCQIRNLAAEKPQVVHECSQLMDQWVAEQLAKSAPQPDPLMEVLNARR